MNKTNFLGKRIPTIVGLLILIGGLVAGVILVSQRQGLGTKAGPTSSPKDVRITNLMTNNFSVSWTTDIPTTGFIKYSENPAKIQTPAGDSRDQISGTAQSYTNHYVNITGLKADTTYYFVIGSGPETYNDQGKPFQVKTGPQVIPPAEDVINGKVLDSSNNPVNGAIVFVEPEGGGALSTVTKIDGTWRLNLTDARDSSGKVLTYDKDNTVLSIFIQAGTNGTATAITNTSKDSPVPDITLGKNQSFISTLPTQITEASSSGVISTGFTSLAAAPTETVATTAAEENSGPVSILNPALNGEMIATSEPQFKGKALPNSDIKITVESTPQTTSLTADANGDWSWTPPEGLDPGNHTVTLTYTDSNGVLSTITRQFTVLAYDESTGLPAFTATPSATVTQEITPTPVATETATPTPTEEIVMPATESSTLTSTGSEMSYMVIGSGVLLLLISQAAKLWIKKNDVAGEGDGDD